MEGEFKYFIYSVTLVGDDLPQGPRVIRVPKEGGLNAQGTNVYTSIEDLKRNDPVVQWLKQNNQKRYQQIFTEKNIITVSDFAISTDNFEREALKILLHSMSGEFSRNGVQGVHYISSSSENHVRIVEVLQGPDCFGVMKVTLEVYNRNRKKWVLKERPSTTRVTEYIKYLNSPSNDLYQYS